jgi:hypothetical protein
VKSELKHHLTPLFLIFCFISLFWLFGNVVWYQFVYLFFGFLWGSFFLDLDHLVYWFLLEPKLPESFQARQLLKERNVLGLIKLLEKNHKNHTSLIFHHYFFQIVLALTTLFVISSSGSIFTSAFAIAINIHLLTDEIVDFRLQPRHLQNWLFARETKQIPQEFLPHYLLTFLLFSLIFLFGLIKLPL